MPAPKLFRSFPDESNLSTAGTDEPAQLSYVNGETPGGTSGFAPHRCATHTDSPSLSIATPFRAPHVLPSGRFPQGAMDWYGSVLAQAPNSIVAANATISNNLKRYAGAIGLLLSYAPCAFPAKTHLIPPWGFGTSPS